MLCKVYSPWTDFVCSFPSVLFFSKEVFGAFSAEKGEKCHIMECYLVWKTAHRLLFRRQEKVKMMDVLTFLVLSHFYIGSMLLPLKSILPPFCMKMLYVTVSWEITHWSILVIWGIKPKQQNRNVTQNKRKKSNIPEESQSLPYSPSLLFYPGRLPNPPSPFIFHIGEIHK